MAKYQEGYWANSWKACMDALKTCLSEARRNQGQTYILDNLYLVTGCGMGPNDGAEGEDKSDERTVLIQMEAIEDLAQGMPDSTQIRRNISLSVRGDFLEEAGFYN